MGIGGLETLVAILLRFMTFTAGVFIGFLVAAVMGVVVWWRMPSLSAGLKQDLRESLEEATAAAEEAEAEAEAQAAAAAVAGAAATTTFQGYAATRHSGYDNVGGAYTLWELWDLLDGDSCDRIRELASQHGLDAGKSENEPFRVARLPDESDEVLSSFAATVSSLTGMPVSHQEETHVRCYEEGASEEPRGDAGAEDVNRGAGPRAATVTVFLNDEYSGGDVVFPALGVTIKPKKGKAILYMSLSSKQKDLNPRPFSVRAMNTVEGGQAWTATKWVHIRPFPPHPTIRIVS